MHVHACACMCEGPPSMMQTRRPTVEMRVAAPGESGMKTASMYVCMHVCMHVCTRACMPPSAESTEALPHAHTCTHIYIYERRVDGGLPHASMDARPATCMHGCMHAHAHAHAMHVRVHVCMYTCVHLRSWCTRARSRRRRAPRQGGSFQGRPSWSEAPSWHRRCLSK